MEGLPLGEVADALGIGAVATRARVSRARRRLRQALEDTPKAPLVVEHQDRTTTETRTPEDRS